MNRRIALALTTIALSGLILSAGEATAQQKSLKEQLVGAWTFVSAADSDNRQLFGPNSKGVMILDASGQYAQIIVRPDVPKFATNNRLQGTPEENKAAVEGTTANFGTWTVDEGSKTLTVHYVGGMFPNQTGTDSKRTIVSVTADELKLHVAAIGAGGSTDNVWRRAK